MEKMDSEQKQKLKVFRSSMFHMVYYLRRAPNQSEAEYFDKNIDFLQSDYKRLSAPDFIKKWDHYWLYYA